MKPFCLLLSLEEQVSGDTYRKIAEPIAVSHKMHNSFVV